MFLLLFLPAFVATAFIGKEVVNVVLYYECLCPDCIAEFPQLPSVVRTMKDQMVLDTVPFGNGLLINNNTAALCQHGENECYGNKLHACAIKQINETQAYVDFNSCMMENRSNDTAADSCGKKFNVNSTTIKACAKSDEGEKLLLEYGKRTTADMQNVTQRYVPYVTVNGKEASTDIYNHTLLYQVCSGFKNPPVACKNATYVA